MDYSSDNQFMRGILIAIILIGLFFALSSIEKRDELSAEMMDDVVTDVREQYDTESVTLLKKLEENEEYLKCELLVEGEIKQAFYIKDTSEVVVIE